MAITPAFVAKLVKLADTLTKDLQATILHTPCTGSSGTGKTYGDEVSRKAVVNYEQRQVRSVDGSLVMSRARVTITTAGVTVTADDKIILPDGSTGPILLVTGPANASTGLPYVTEVYLG